MILCVVGRVFFITAELERKVMLEQGLGEAGLFFTFPSVAEGGVLGIEALQAFTCPVQ